jgi:hypothetical protein
MDRASASRLWPGIRASVAVPALGEQGLDARVVSVVHGVQKELAGSEVIVRVRLDSPRQGLRPGMSSIVDFVAASRPGALAVPNHALTGGAPGPAGAWTIRRGVIALAPVVLGLRGDFYSEVLAGLVPGTLVVTGPATVVQTLGIGDRAAAVPAPVQAP